MTIDQHTATGLLTPIGLQLDITSLEVRLDEAWSPYCKGTIVCALPAPEDRDLVDLRTDALYLELRIRQDFGDPWSLAELTADIGGSLADLTALLGGLPLSRITNRYYRPWNGPTVREPRRRVFKLYVVGRSLVDEFAEMTLDVASLEAVLLGDALLGTTPVDPGTTSLRAIAVGVLARHGLTLEAGDADATVAETAATVWQPGVSAAAYLDPMLEAASLRLWCDEAGTFRLEERQATKPGAVTITPTGTMVSHTDTMSLDPEVWFDAVVVEYRYTDEFDLNQVAYDSAGTEPARATKTFKRDTRYPGPGAAAGILSRAQGRGRSIEVGAVSDYSATPGSAITIAPPAGDAQTGYVSAVAWRLPEAEMTVYSRGLTDTPETSWLYAEPGLSWLDVPLGMSWLEYDPEVI